MKQKTDYRIAEIHGWFYVEKLTDISRDPYRENMEWVRVYRTENNIPVRFRTLDAARSWVLEHIAGPIYHEI